MKLATYQDGSRDGQLVVVSRDLRQAHYATGTASRLLAVFDDWNFLAPQLQDLYDELNAGRLRHAFAFQAERCLAPLPRATQCLRGGAYPSHGQLLHQAWPQTWPEPRRAEPVMAQVPSDDFLPPLATVHVASEVLEPDFGAELWAVCGDLRQGASPERALDAVRLLGLANAFALRRLQAEPGGDVQARVATACAPVLITPDELGPGWQQGRAQATLQCSWNGRKFGLCDAASDMRFGFGDLLAHAAKTRRLRTGTVVTTGPVSNAGVASDTGRLSWPKGFCSALERQAMEQVQDQLVSTGFLCFGDTLRVEAKGRDGQSLFGALEQTLMPLDGAS